MSELTFACPRCGNETSEAFYGPCMSCREELRATLGGQARTIEVAAYEPKMNVTPNAVALKE
jgi:ribosomal protein S27E